jgi:hypothetical protein
MAFVGLEELLRFLSGRAFLSLPPWFFHGLYPVKALSVALLLFIFRKRYDEISFMELRSPSVTLAAIAVGIAVFAFWIRLDLPWATIGSPAGFDPTVIRDQGTKFFVIAARLLGAVVVVPVMEELFWRSFLIRYIISPDFTSVPIGKFTWPSFIFTSLFFGLEHNLFFAGILAGIFYNLLLYRTKSLSSCIAAHGVTNLLLGIYVLNSAQWRFW